MQVLVHRGRLAGLVIAVFWLSVASGLLPPVAQAQPGSGPDQMRETYRDWIVRCTQPGDGAGPARCEMSQTLSRGGESPGRVLEIVLSRTQGGEARVTYATPFGVDLGRGIEVLVDDATVDTQPFRTCQPRGCIVTSALSPLGLSRFQGGSQGIVRIWNLEGGAMDLRFSLAGFSGAWNRLAEL